MSEDPPKQRGRPASYNALQVVSCVLEPHQRDYLQNVSAATNKSISAVVRSILDSHIQRETKRKRRNERAEESTTQ